MSDFKKGSTVWYFDRILKQWRKGKVIAVNRNSLAIKKRHNAYSGEFAKYEGLVINGSLPKPTLSIKDFTESRGWYTKQKYNLLVKFGIKAKY